MEQIIQINVSDAVFCAYLTTNNSYEMNIGPVNLEFGDKKQIPITCRQSDIQRAKKISSKLKQLKVDQKFEL